MQSTPRGLSGPQLGGAAGQSTEFVDHRVYVAGDDADGLIGTRLHVQINF